MKYTLTKRDIGILLGFLGIVILGLTYYFVYMGYSGKTEELNASNEAMQARVDVLQDLVDRQSELVAETEKNNREAEAVMDQFPSDYRYEDAILFGLELNEVAPFSEFPAITFSEAESIYTFQDIEALANEQVRGYIPGGIPAPASVEGEEAPAEQAAPTETAPAVSLPELFKKETSYTSVTDYAGLKNMLAYVVGYEDRSGMNITAVYDEEKGMLNNVLNLKSYYVINTDKPYEEPVIPTVVKGTDDLFNTFSVDRSNRPNMGEGGRISEESLPQVEGESEED